MAEGAHGWTESGVPLRWDFVSPIARFRMAFSADAVAPDWLALREAVMRDRANGYRFQ